MTADRDSGVIAQLELGLHVLLNGDSSVVAFQPSFEMVLISPPYFHPKQTSHIHGLPSHFRDLNAYADWVARILQRAHSALRPGRAVCFVKTDVKYKGSLLPVGFDPFAHKGRPPSLEGGRFGTNDDSTLCMK